MNIKKICKILGTTTAMLSAVILAGIINNSPVYAAENNLESNPAENITSSSAVSVNQVIKKDYKIDVNTSIEKQGFKLTIKNVTATKHNLKVVASIEGNKLSDYYKDLSRDAILQMTVKNTESRSTDLISKKINDNTLEFTFNIESLKDFPDNIELRFDALLPQFDLNGWVNTKVDISKYFDKTYSEDIEFEMGENNFSAEFLHEKSCVSADIFKNIFSGRTEISLVHLLYLIFTFKMERYHAFAFLSFFGFSDRKSVV